MRLLGVLVVAMIMYVAAPLLWQRTMVNQVKAVSANSAAFPTGNAVAANWPAGENLVNGVTQPVEINEEEINKSEQIGAHAAADDALRQAQAAQDRAWAATH